MSTNIANYEAVLKEVYAPAISREFIRNKVLLEKLEKSSDFVDLSGKYYVVPVALTPNQCVGSAGELDTGLGYSQQTITQDAKYYSWIQYAWLQISKRALDGSTSPEAAWENIKDFEFQNIIETLRQNCNRQCYGDGTGSLCTVASASNAAGVTTVTLNNTTGINASNPTKYIKVNRSVDILTSGGTAHATKAQITGFNPATPSFTINEASTNIAAGDIVYLTNSRNKEWDGLAKIIAPTGAVGGIDPATAGNENWAAYRDTTGGAIGYPIIQKAFDQIEINGGKVDLMIGAYGVYRAAATYLETQKRIPVEGTVKLAGGASGMTWNGVEFYKDIDCPDGQLNFIDYDAIQFGQIGDPGWLDNGGIEGGILIPVPQSFLYQAMYYWDSNIITIHRNRLAAIENLTAA